MSAKYSMLFALFNEWIDSVHFTVGVSTEQVTSGVFMFDDCVRMRSSDNWPGWRNGVHHNSNDNGVETNGTSEDNNDEHGDESGSVLSSNESC